MKHKQRGDGVTIYAKNYSALSKDGDNTMELVEAMLALENGDILILEKKIYHLYGKFAFTKDTYISNNSSGKKRCVFLLDGKKNIVIDGNGAELIFHGYVSPFIINNCENITVKNLKIDYASPMFAQARIEEADTNHLLLDFDTCEMDCSFENNRFCFENKNDDWKQTLECVLVQEFSKSPTAPGIKQTYFAYTGKKRTSHFLNSMTKDVELKPLDNGKVLMKGYLTMSHNVGNWWVSTFGNRENPTIAIISSKDITVSDVTVYYTPAMGVIAQLSENITLCRFNTIPRKNSGRLISANADSTHFVSCRGKVIINDCIFTNMMDDGGNIHGTYVEYVRKISRTALLAGFLETPQIVEHLFLEGDEVCFRSMENRILTVKKCDFIGGKYLRIEFYEEVPDIPKGEYIENLSGYPEVYISRVKCGNNRPHGFMLASRKKTVVEKCTFFNMSSALKIGGAGAKWHESGCVSDLTVKDCVFEHSAYAGGMALWVRREELNGKIIKDAHRNISISGNTFIMPDKRFIKAESADNLVFRDNTFVRDTSRQSVGGDCKSEGAILENCGTVIYEAPKEKQ